MVPTITRFAAETTVEVGVKGGWNPVAAKAFMLGIAFFGAAIGLGWIGQAYMKALGRNPEAGKAAGQIVIIAAMVEVTALLAFLGAIIIKQSVKKKKVAFMLSTLHRKNFQFAFTVPFRTVHLRASFFTRTVSQHETDHSSTRLELNPSEGNEIDRRIIGNSKENVNV